MANSQSDMEEWVRTLRRVIGVPTSGGSVKTSNVGNNTSTLSHVLPLVANYMFPCLLPDCNYYI